MREIFLTPDLSISGNLLASNFGFCGRKGPPPPRMRENFFRHQIYPFQVNFEFGFCGRKAPLKGKFLTPDYPFQAISSNLVFGRKAPPPGWENFLTPDLSISGNFEQLWFLWQKSQTPPGWGKIFWHQIYPFQAISSNFGFCGRKAPPPQDEGKFFDTRSIHFRQFWATLVFVAEKPNPTQDEGNFFDTRSIHFRQLRENFFDTRSIHFRQFWATLVFVAEKPTRMREIFLTSDLSISGNFEQLWFLWQKSPPPPRMRENFLTPDLSISGNFEQLWFLWQKSPPTRSIHFRQFQATLVFVTEKPPLPGWGEIFWHQIYPFQAILSNFGFCGRKAPPPRMRENFLTPDLSISGNFEQLWFLWQKSPPAHWMREHFLTGWGEIFWHQIYPFQAILSNFGFCGRKAPPTLPGWGKIFWHQIFPFQAILSNFGFCGRKAPLPLFSLFVRDWARITQVEYPRSPYYKSILRFLLSKYLL